MVDLPKKKVGIVACSGEELPEGTVTRLAALKVLEQLRPGSTVTICLPLFLAGGEGDRTFARFYPTIAVDGCELRCAAQATEKYSGKPAASIVVTDLVSEKGLDSPQGRRRLNEAGRQAVELTAQRIAEHVDAILEKHWNRRAGAFREEELLAPAGQIPDGSLMHPVQATCSCGSGIPVQILTIEGLSVEVVALPLIFEQLAQQPAVLEESLGDELLKTVAIYNSIPVGKENAYRQALVQEYSRYLEDQETVR